MYNCSVKRQQDNCKSCENITEVEELGTGISWRCRFQKCIKGVGCREEEKDLWTKKITTCCCENNLCNGVRDGGLSMEHPMEEATEELSKIPKKEETKKEQGKGRIVVRRKRLGHQGGSGGASEGGNNGGSQ